MIDADSFVSIPQIGEAGHGQHLEETNSWIQPLVRRVPITRITDVTPLDFLGLPCWAAIAPLARDLTTHAGKGLSPLAARLSAIMEAIERVSAEQIPEASEVRRASYFELCEDASANVVNPRECGLPFNSSYSESKLFSWMRAFDFIQSEAIWIPIDIIVSPAIEDLRCGPNTNGLAAGNSITEATLHAACEVIERDAVAQHEFWNAFAEASDVRQLSQHPLDLNTFPTEALELALNITRDGTGLSLIVSELPNESDMPVYAATIVDPNYPTLEGFMEINHGGWGCDIDARRALIRAITEAVQCRAITIQGARDSSEGGQVIDRRWSLCRAMELRRPMRRISFDYKSGGPSGDLLLDLKNVCSRISRAGYRRLIVADLTRSDLQVPVVRVVIPGMASPLRYGLHPNWGQLEQLL